MTPPCKRGMRSRVARLPASSNCAHFPAPNFGGIDQLVDRLVRNGPSRFGPEMVLIGQDGPPVDDDQNGIPEYSGQDRSGAVPNFLTGGDNRG